MCVLCNIRLLNVKIYFYYKKYFSIAEEIVYVILSIQIHMYANDLNLKRFIQLMRHNNIIYMKIRMCVYLKCYIF